MSSSAPSVPTTFRDLGRIASPDPSSQRPTSFRFSFVPGHFTSHHGASILVLLQISMGILQYDHGEAIVNHSLTDRSFVRYVVLP